MRWQVKGMEDVANVEDEIGQLIASSLLGDHIGLIGVSVVR